MCTGSTISHAVYHPPPPLHFSLQWHVVIRPQLKIGHQAANNSFICTLNALYAHSAYIKYVPFLPAENARRFLAHLWDCLWVKRRKKLDSKSPRVTMNPFCCFSLFLAGSLNLLANASPNMDRIDPDQADTGSAEFEPTRRSSIDPEWTGDHSVVLDGDQGHVILRWGIQGEYVHFQVVLLFLNIFIHVINATYTLYCTTCSYSKK